METKKITTFTDLFAWREGHKLALLIYKTTKEFPSEERFSLTDQIRRAAISITSNMAEGFSRHSSKEKIQFYYTSFGSLTELQNQLLLARDLSYIKSTEFKILADQSIVTKKLITGLIKSLKLKASI